MRNWTKSLLDKTVPGHFRFGQKILDIFVVTLRFSFFVLSFFVSSFLSYLLEEPSGRGWGNPLAGAGGTGVGVSQYPVFKMPSKNPSIVLIIRESNNIII